jgi:alkylhydroperoxidase family enzyme
VRAHTAAGKLQGLPDDAPWYEAALLVGVTNALNVVADSPLASLEPAHPSAEAEAVFAEIRAFYACADVPVVFRRVAADPGYLSDLWGATRRAFADNRLSRRHKEALAFAVSVTTRSSFGTAFHLGEMRRLGVGERGVMEVLGVTQMFSSYTKIADTLQLEPDMGEIAPVDRSPAPGGAQHSAPAAPVRPPEAP